MISKAEFLYMKERIKRLENELFDFENATGNYSKEVNEEMYSVYQMYEKYKRLSGEQRIELHKKWDEYYKKCQESEMGRLFQACGKLHSEGKIAEVKQTIQRAQAITYKVPKPSSMDPNELMEKMKGYFMARKKITDLKELVEEFNGVYSTKSKEETL